MVKTVTLSIKKVPVDLAERLKARADRNHRSLQGELQAILEEAGHMTSISDLAALVRRMGLETPAESARMVREDRDARRR